MDKTAQPRGLSSRRPAEHLHSFLLASQSSLGQRYVSALPCVPEGEHRGPNRINGVPLFPVRRNSLS